MMNEDVLRKKITELGASNDFVSVLSGVPQSTLSQALRGVKPLPRIVSGLWITR